MNSEERKDPEEILSAIKREESQSNKGRLKIFIGMAAGVGKTYAMLEEAKKLQQAGVNVIVGIVDTHGRNETAFLLQGLKIIPEKTLDYKGIKCQDLDLESILHLQPGLVLVDELAHSNIPGLKHTKRWQDIIEILENGIDVYTTINVQHIESLNDIVKRIAGVAVKETVPDFIIEKATSIQLVDLTPDELLKRLKEGKVYLGDQSQIAPLHFFQKDRLAALREMALRYVAEKVERDLRNSVPTSENVIDWRLREKFLVAISHSPYSQELIRATKRLASSINAPWIAVNINNGQSLSEKENNQLVQNLKLASDLGAEVVTINDTSIVDGIKRIAKQRGITQIILGRTPKYLSFDIFKKSTLLDRLSTECTDIDVHIIRQESLTAKTHRFNFSSPNSEQITPYVFVFLYVCLLNTINWFLLSTIGYKVIGVIFLIGILSLSFFFRKGPIFFASILYAFAWDFFFIPPAGQLIIASNEDLALLALYVLTAIVIGILVDKARTQKEMLAKNEASTRLLYNIGQRIALAHSTQTAFTSVKEQLSKLFNGEFEILAKQIHNGALDIPIPLLVEGIEKNTILWVFENGKEAGRFTDTLPSAKSLYLPLKGFHEVMGILIFNPKTNKSLLPEEKGILYAVCNQLANYLERLFSAEITKQYEQLQQTENIHQAILSRLSHEFETPLKNSKNAITEWKNKNSQDSKEIGEVEQSFHVLHKIISNISAMAQLSEGMIPINKSDESIQELVTKCCDTIKMSQNHHKITINIEENLPLLSFDFYLIHMLLYNLIINALEYSPPSSKVEIEAKQTGDFLALSVTDEGMGIPENQLDVIFEKFYRLPETTSPGVGLGLAIAKTIAEAHHGYLKAENLFPKGMKFSLFLPMENPSHGKGAKKLL